MWPFWQKEINWVGELRFRTCWCGHSTSLKLSNFSSDVFFFFLIGSRRSRTRSRGQLLAKNSKGTTLEFEADFDFETANAQFRDDLTKEATGKF